MDQKPKKLLEQVREKIRLKNYSIKTGQAYVYWIKKFILFHDRLYCSNSGKTEALSNKKEFSGSRKKQK